MPLPATSVLQLSSRPGLCDGETWSRPEAAVRERSYQMAIANGQRTGEIDRSDRSEEADARFLRILG